MIYFNRDGTLTTRMPIEILSSYYEKVMYLMQEEKKPIADFHFRLYPSRCNPYLKCSILICLERLIPEEEKKLKFTKIVP